MKRVLSKALSILVAFTIGIAPIESNAGYLGIGSSGQGASPLDTTKITVNDPPACPECEYENTATFDLSGDDFCSRRSCNSLSTGDKSMPRVAVANLEWKEYDKYTAAEAKAMRAEVEKKWDLPQLSAATANNSMPESSLNNFRSLRVLNKNPSAAAKALSATAVTPSMRDTAGPPIILGTYASSDGSLHIEAVRSIKTIGGGVTIQTTDVTPRHFDLFKATQAFTTKEEQLEGKMGRNPFDFAKSANAEDDAIFRSLSMDGAKVAMGLAMRQVGAAYAVMTVTKDDWRQWQRKKGGWFKKKIEYHTAVDTTSIYYVFTPATTIYAGDDAVICADSPSNTSCPAELAVRSGVTAAQWTGGTFEEVKQLETYHHVKTIKKSFNFLKVLVIAVLVVVSVGYLAPLIAAALPSALTGAVSAMATAVTEGVAAAIGVAPATVASVGSAVIGSVPYGGGLVGAAATAVGVSAEMAVGIAAGWNYSAGEVVNFTKAKANITNPENEHVLAHNRKLRGFVRKNMRDVGVSYGNTAPTAVNASALGNGSKSMNNVMIPAGAIGMYVQRGRVKADQHAERVVDVEADLEMSH